ncbi:hypothetical protein [Microcoleus sp.]|uniref:hypothetical protein n=1 Tax=Microcoleus sp. TaxID=44472 RepID=UPI0035939739
MKRKTLSFLVVALFTVTAGMAARVNAASQEVQKQNLPSVQAQANVSQAIPVALPADAEILMKGGDKRDGKVVQIDEKAQKLLIQLGQGQEKRSIPLGQIEKIVFPKSAAVYLDPHKGPVLRGELPPATNNQAKWNGIPISAFKLKDAAKGQAVVNLGPPVVNRAQLRGIVGVAKDRQFVVDEMQFDVQKKTMTIVATPY